MAVEVLFVVTRKGVRMMETISEAEARAYDRMLDQAEALAPLLAAALAQSGIPADERALEELTISLAKRRDEVLLALGAKKGGRGDEGAERPSRRRKGDSAEPALAQVPLQDVDAA